MNIALSGYFGFGNAGDEAILSAIIKLIKQYDSAIQITVLSDNPDETMKTYGVHAVNRWRLFDVWRTLKHSDGLISGGGSLLQDKTGWRSVPYYLGIMFMARRRKKPYVVFAQGIGPINKSYNQWLTKKIISQSSFISVRDEASKKLLQAFGVKKNITVVPDPVFALEEDVSDSLKRNAVTVTVRNWPSREDFLRKMALALDRVSDQGYDVIFVPMHGESDAAVSKQVADMMNNRVTIASHHQSYQEKMNIIGSGKVLFGMRLHSLIFAAISHTPFVALDYDPKITAFAESCGQPVVGSVDDPWSADDLYNLIIDQIDRSEEIENHLAKVTSSWKSEVQQTMQEILGTYFNSGGPEEKQ